MSLDATIQRRAERPLGINSRALIVAAALTALCACQGSEDRAQERVEDRIEDSADVGTIDVGPAPAVLGLTEQQLLGADLVSSGGEQLGDVEAIRRDAAGEVVALAIEIDDSGTSRLVEIPIEGLSTTADGGSTNILAAMTLDELASFPDVRRE